MALEAIAKASRGCSEQMDKLCSAKVSRPGRNCRRQVSRSPTHGAGPGELRSAERRGLETLAERRRRGAKRAQSLLFATARPSSAGERGTLGANHVSFVPESGWPLPPPERMVNGRAAASGEKRIDLSEEIAWFGDILNIDGPLVEIGARSVFDNSAVGVRQ